MSEKGTRRRPLELLSAYLPAALSVLLGACLYITLSCCAAAKATPVASTATVATDNNCFLNIICLPLFYLNSMTAKVQKSKRTNKDFCIF